MDNIFHLEPKRLRSLILIWFNIYFFIIYTKAICSDRAEENIWLSSLIMGFGSSTLIGLGHFHDYWVSAFPRSLGFFAFIDY